MQRTPSQRLVFLCLVYVLFSKLYVCLESKLVHLHLSQIPINKLIGKGKAKPSIIRWCTLALCISEFASLQYICKKHLHVSSFEYITVWFTLRSRQAFNGHLLWPSSESLASDVLVVLTSYSIWCAGVTTSIWRAGVAIIDVCRQRCSWPILQLHPSWERVLFSSLVESNFEEYRTILRLNTIPLHIGARR